MKDFKAKLVSREELTHDVVRFVFAPDSFFEFKPGQFVMIKVDDDKDPAANRAYSIASRPGERNFELAIKLLEGGRGSEYLDDLNEGDWIDCKGPFGHFILDETSEKDVLFVATGTGVAPMNSMLMPALENGRKVTLLFGVRHIKDVFWKEHFEDIASRHPNFDFKLTLSQPEDESWTGLTGRVTDHLSNFDPSNLQVYICGNKSMIDNVKDHFLEVGVPENDVKNEVFWNF